MTKSQMSQHTLVFTVNTGIVFFLTADVLSPDVYEMISRGQHTLSVSCWSPRRLHHIKDGVFYNRVKKCGLRGRYLSLICFHTQIHKHIIHTVLSGQRTDMKVGGDEWLISAAWRGRRELNELSLFWGLCMRIHCYIFTVASEKKNLG